VVIGKHPAEVDGVHPPHVPTPHTLYVPAALPAAAATEPLKPSAYKAPERTLAVPLPQRLMWAALGAALATAATLVTPWALTNGVNHARGAQRRAARLCVKTRTHATQARAAVAAALRPVISAARPAVIILKSVRRGFVTRRQSAKAEVRHPHPPLFSTYHAETWT
jgi:hypothetical protein